MDELQIGDVVRWASTSNSSGSLSRGPFRIIGKSVWWHAASLDGSPLLPVNELPGYGGDFYYVTYKEVIKDEFLTAASKAVASEGKDGTPIQD